MTMKNDRSFKPNAFAMSDLAVWNFQPNQLRYTMQPMMEGFSKRPIQRRLDDGDGTDRSITMEKH